MLVLVGTALKFTGFRPHGIDRDCDSCINVDVSIDGSRSRCSEVLDVFEEVIVLVKPKTCTEARV